MLIKSLAAELSHILECFRELGTCLEQETIELSHINLEAMESLNRQKEDIAAKLEKRSASMAKCLEDVASSLGLAQGSSLGVVSQALRARGNLEIPKLHKELNSVGDNNRRLLLINREIAESFSTSVGNTLEILSRLINQSSFYGASGGYQQRPAGSVFINREA